MPKPPATTRTDSQPDLIGSYDTYGQNANCLLSMSISGLWWPVTAGTALQHRGNASYPWLKLGCWTMLAFSVGSSCPRKKGSGLGSSQPCQDACQLPKAGKIPGWKYSANIWKGGIQRKHGCLFSVGVLGTARWQSSVKLQVERWSSLDPDQCGDMAAWSSSGLCSLCTWLVLKGLMLLLAP